MIVDLYDDKVEIDDDSKALLVRLLGKLKFTINGNEIKNPEEKENEKTGTEQEDEQFKDEEIDNLITTLTKNSSTQSHLNHLHRQLASHLTHTIQIQRRHSHIPRKSALDPTYLNTILLSKTIHDKRLKYINRLKQKLSRPSSAKLAVSSNYACLVRTPWNETLRFKGEGLVFGYAEREIERAARGLNECEGYSGKWKELVAMERKWEKLIARNGVDGEDGKGKVCKGKSEDGKGGDWEFVFREPVKQLEEQKRRAVKQKEQFNKKLRCIYDKLKPVFDSMFVNSRVNFQRLLIELQLHYGGGEGSVYLDVVGEGDLGELLKKHGFADPLKITGVPNMKTKSQLFKENPFGDELHWVVKEQDLRMLNTEGVRMSLDKKKRKKAKN
ncbi:unnamed protein product [Ambrosiozyma monospora]|uniref:Unnamed protein product n=1 Tax=Ambrosiozyma monospora TaxID=43982 RepID=A0ACB5SUF6_AMBMO|nr:unnamed protein product [Ambrosiozyma monospora]